MDTAIVLAGGKSERMGFDKQLIIINGILIAEYIIDLLKPVFKTIILVTNRQELYNDKSIIIAQDYFKDFGPLGGMHAGLTMSKSQYNYIIACDMPYINITYIDYMKKRIEEDDFESLAVITRFGEWIEPFNAFYSKALIPQIEESIERKERRISSIFSHSKPLYIEEKTARQFSPDWNMFANLNELHDLKKWNIKTGYVIYA